MKVLTGLPARLFLVVFTGCCVAASQQDDGVRGAQGTIRNGVSVSESFLVAGPGLEIWGIVTEQPYSADQVSERKQTLTNGTHIDQKREMSRMYRDSEGRTRTERSFFLGPVDRSGAKDTAPRMIHIYDPVAEYSYTLDEQKHVAHRFTVSIPSESQKAARTTGTLAPLPTGQPVAGKTASVNKVLQQRQIKRESLGTDVIDGIQVEGERLSITTPTGVEGNDRPLTRVCEHWRSEELKLTLLAKCTDPRFGNSTMRIQNLDRTEPDPALFQVSPDYEIVEETGPFAVGFGQTVGVR